MAAAAAADQGKDLSFSAEAGSFRSDALECFMFDALRPQRQGSASSVGAAAAQRIPEPYLAKKVVWLLAKRFHQDGLVHSTRECSKSLCPRKTGALLDANIDAAFLAEVFRAMLRLPSPYGAPSGSVYAFMGLLEQLWSGAPDRLAQLFWTSSAVDLLEHEPELFHFAARSCGCRLRDYTKALATSVEDVERVCSERAGASVMWHLARAGALSEELLGALSDPLVFFHRLGFSGFCAAKKTWWSISLTLPLWLGCFGDDVKAKLSSAVAASWARTQQLPEAMMVCPVLRACVLAESRKAQGLGARSGR